MASLSAPHYVQMMQGGNQNLDPCLEAEDRGLDESSLKSHLAHFGLPDGRSLGSGSWEGLHEYINAQIPAPIKQQAGMPGTKELNLLSFQGLHDDVNAQILAQMQQQAATLGTNKLKLLSFQGQGMHDDLNAQILAQIKQQASTSGTKGLKLLSFQGQRTVLKDNGKPFVCQLAGGYSDHPLAHCHGCCAPCSFAYRHQQDPKRYPHECLRQDCGRCHKAHSPEYMRKYKGDVQRFRRQKEKTNRQHVMFEGGFIF